MNLYTSLPLNLYTFQLLTISWLIKIYYIFSTKINKWTYGRVSILNSKDTYYICAFFVNAVLGQIV